MFVAGTKTRARACAIILPGTVCGKDGLLDDVRMSVSGTRPEIPRGWQSLARLPRWKKGNVRRSTKRYNLDHLMAGEYSGYVELFLQEGGKALLLLVCALLAWRMGQSGMRFFPAIFASDFWPGAWLSSARPAWLAGMGWATASAGCIPGMLRKPSRRAISRRLSDSFRPPWNGGSPPKPDHGKE